VIPKKEDLSLLTGRLDQFKKIMSIYIGYVGL
jgi:hypothetical protein